MNTRKPAFRRTHKHQRGYGLLEALVAMVIMGLIVGGTMDLYITITRSAARTQAETFATLDAAVAVHNLIDQTREAHWFALPGEVAPTTGTALFTPLPNYTAITNYQTTVAGTTVDTALMLALPSVRSGASVFTVNTVNGQVSVTGAFNRNYSGNLVLIYRANSTGVPNAASGTYLWEYSLSDSGATYNKALTKSIATVGNGIQFARPVDSSGAIQPFEVQIKVICGYYSIVNGIQTNEATDGTSTSQLTGMCVLMRDHEMDSSHEPNVAKPGDTVGIGNHWIRD